MQAFAYDLLIPLVVKEKLIPSGTSFTNAEVSYKSGIDDVYGRIYEVEIKLFNQNLNDFIVVNFILDNDEIGTIEEILQSAVNRNEYKIGISTNEKVFEGDWQWALEDIPPKFTIPEVNELEK